MASPQPDDESISAPSTPIVSFLGPVASYTHQVHTLLQHDRPAWTIGLTDYDLAQAALTNFEADRYNYEPAETITGDNVFSQQTSCFLTS
jgi:hypothetical protein